MKEPWGVESLLPQQLLWIWLVASTLLGAGAPTRVVSQTVGTDDLLLALAAPGQIAALSHLSRDERYSPSCREALKLPSLSTSGAEAVLRYKPDLVLAACYTQAEVLELLKKAKVNLLILEKFESLDDLYANTRRIGKALRREVRAEELIAQWLKRVEVLRQKLLGVAPVRVLAAGLYPFTAGSGTTFQDICEHSGAINVAAEAGLFGHVPTPNEKVLMWKIDTLVGPGEAGLDLMARLKELSPYKFLPILKEGHLVVLPGFLMSATSQARLDSYEALAKALHPERFP